MINKQMKIISNNIKNIKDAQDGSFGEYFHQALNILGVSLENTIEYFKTASEEEVYWLSCTWEELSLKFKSQDLLSVFIELKDKYPGIAKDICDDINAAEKAIKNAR